MLEDFFSVRIFLNKNSGNMMLARTVTSQITRGAKIHAERLFISSPFVNSIVNTRATSVVTRAMPPRKAGAYLIATFSTKGENRMLAMVKNPTLTKKPNPVI